jgi:hypothetical protein
MQSGSLSPNFQMLQHVVRQFVTKFPDVATRSPAVCHQISRCCNMQSDSLSPNFQMLQHAVWQFVTKFPDVATRSLTVCHQISRCCNMQSDSLSPNFRRHLLSLSSGQRSKSQRTGKVPMSIDPFEAECLYCH